MPNPESSDHMSNTIKLTEYCYKESEVHLCLPQSYESEGTSSHAVDPSFLLLVCLPKHQPKQAHHKDPEEIITFKEVNTLLAVNSHLKVASLHLKATVLQRLTRTELSWCYCEMHQNRATGCFSTSLPALFRPSEKVICGMWVHSYPSTINAFEKTCCIFQNCNDSSKLIQSEQKLELLKCTALQSI